MQGSLEYFRPKNWQFNHSNLESTYCSEFKNSIMAFKQLELRERGTPKPTASFLKNSTFIKKFDKYRDYHKTNCWVNFSTVESFLVNAESSDVLWEM